MTFGWGPMRILSVFAMCTCASPEVGRFQGGHRNVKLIYWHCAGTVQKHPQRGNISAPGKVSTVTTPPTTLRGHVSVWDLLT